MRRFLILFLKKLFITMIVWQLCVQANWKVIIIVFITSKVNNLETFSFENYIKDNAKIIFLKDDKIGILGASTESILDNKYRYIIQLDQETEDLFLSIEILDRTYALSWHNAEGKIINTLQLSAPKFKTIESILKDKIYTF